MTAEPTTSPESLTLNLADVGALTIAEAADFEDHGGPHVLSWVERGAPVAELSMKALRALVWILVRRERPDFTLEDAGKVELTALASAAPAEPDRGAAATAPNGPRALPGQGKGRRGQPGS